MRKAEWNDGPVTVTAVIQQKFNQFIEASERSGVPDAESLQRKANSWAKMTEFTVLDLSVLDNAKLLK